MSTFYGGAQLQGVSNITSISSGTKYTCPTGSYAVVELMNLSAGDQVTIGTSSFSLSGSYSLISGIISFGSLDNDAVAINNFTITSGETIVLPSAVTTFRVNIYEYKQP